MCLIALSVGQSAQYPLVIAANRDEAFDRPTLALSAWTSENGTVIYSGRDLTAGGTWMGFSASGRYAMLTNVRCGAPRQQLPGQTSRGLLVKSWLNSQISATQYAQEITQQHYQGFNLLIGDAAHGQLHYLSNQDTDFKQNRPLASVNIAQSAIFSIAKALTLPANHQLSNARLDTPWPKSLTLQTGLQALLRLSLPLAALQNELLELLSNTSRYPDEQLPCTGVSLEAERALSSCFVRIGEQHQARYGTRSSTVAIWEATSGQLHLLERSWGVQMQAPSVSEVAFSLHWPQA